MATTNRPKVIVLHGAGGIGKTKLASEFAREHHHRFSSVIFIWLDGSSETSLKQIFTGMAQMLPQDELTDDRIETLKHSAIDVAVRERLRWLSLPSNQRWLLNFDNIDRDFHNADDPRAYNVKEYLPDTDHGSILIASRLATLQKFGLGVKVWTVNTEQARAILESNSGRPIEDADIILDRLNGFPLALTQAGSYTQETNMSVSAYAEHYKADSRVIETYIHLPLEHRRSIRILNLQPSTSKADNIVISLAEARLSDSPYYEALSYSWATEDGDSKSSCAIICDGRQLMVTKNCYAALRRLRRPSKQVVLWVDSICINQSNTIEKNAQVVLMAEVYRTASRVQIWLGEASGVTELSSGKPVSAVFLEYIGPMTDEMRRLEENGKDRTTSPLFCKLRSELSLAVKMNERTPLIQGLWHIKHRRWWRRVWVVQEALLARSATIVCGDSEALYSDLHLWISTSLLRSYPDSREIFGRLEAIGDHMLMNEVVRLAGKDSDPVATKESSRSVELLLSQSRSLDASNNRDHIFALIGLLDNLKIMFPSPNYHISALDLYTRAMRALIECSKSLAILSEADYQGHTLELPSWVVNWSTKPLHLLPGRIRYTYHATGDAASMYSFSGDGKTLRVYGKIIDTIKHLPKAASTAAYTFPYDMRCATAGMKESIGVASAAHALNKRIDDEIIWRTLCWNIDEQFTYPAPKATGDQFCTFWNIVRTETEPKEIVRRLSAEAAYYCNRYIHSMCLCITLVDKLASVPWTAKEGDKIALISGAGTPFVLRSIRSQYHLIGNCFLYGAMDGEAYPSDSQELEWLELS